jgi:dihydrofolate synthase / folylpolyglutamate synthase
MAPPEPAYAETIAWLQGLEVAKGWDLKLDRMRQALAVRGHPERRFRAIHVAGTNGKGSTAAMLESILRAAGHRTGLYTSPHLVDFAERMRAGGLAIPHDTVVALVAELRSVLEPAGVELTHFEFATLLAFEWFARIGVDVAVIEVGLGGRLDATNVLDPIVTGITSIGRDHEEFLGSEIAGIAREKAGIARPGVPLVVGEVPADAAAAIAAVARDVGAPVVDVPRETALDVTPDGLAFRGLGVAWDRLALGVPGGFQHDNLRIALAMLAAARGAIPVGVDAVRTGLATTRWPGRLAKIHPMDRDAPPVVVDGAHNADGVAALVRELPALGRPITLVFAVMADKAWERMVGALVPHVARVIATRVGRRGLDPARIVTAIGGRVPAEAIEPAAGAIAHARATTDAGGVVLVAGSLFLVGEAYALLRRGEPLVKAWQGWDRIGTQARP